MSYNNSIPNPTDFIAISQIQLLSNYQAIFNAFNTNHVALAKNNQGQHASLTFREQMADPATAADQSAFYSKDVSGVPQLFFRPSNSGTAIQMTNSNSSVVVVDSSPDKVNEYRQSSFLAGPFTIYTGYLGAQIGVPFTTTVTLLPATTLIYVGLTMILRSAQDKAIIYVPAAVSVAANTFVVEYQHALAVPPVIYYMAIGV